jgi:anti-sigma factor ChrR (cupin superfamily)
MPKLTKHDRPTSETASLASLYVLGTLTEGERSDFEWHLKQGCAVCDSEVERASAILSALAKIAPATLPSGIQERFKRRVQSEQFAVRDGAGQSILFRESGVLIARTDAMDWREGPFPGVWVKLLYLDQQQQRATSLVRMDPGTRYPSHRHNGPEEVFLLDGDYVVEGQIMRPGDYCNAQPASTHGESYTKAGCKFILSACQLDQILP